MTPEWLKKLLSQGEGITTEFKLCKDKISSSVYETICSFANRYGGHIILGVSDRGGVLGVDPSYVAQMQKDFAITVNNPQKISPPMSLTLEEYELDGKTLLYVYVPASSQVEWCAGRIFDRIEDADIDVSSTERAATLIQLKSSKYRERELFPMVTERELRLDLMPRVRNSAVLRNSNHPWRGMSDIDILKSAGLYEKDWKTGEFGFNLAAILLLGKDEVIHSCAPGYVTDALVRIENTDRYDDRLSVRTNLIESYDILIDYIEKRTLNRFFLIGTQSVNVMSHIAREIVSNTLAHREYARAVPARIVIEKERIYCENWNRARFQGTLDLSGFTPEPKNPLISQFFVNIGLADALGSGMRHLYYYTDIYSGGKAKPILTEGDLFTTEIPIQAAAAGVIHNVPINVPNVPINVPDVPINVPNVPINVPINVPNVPINVPINDIALQALHVMTEYPKVSLNEIAEKIGRTRKTVQRAVRDLKKNGYVKRVGSRKTGHWEVLSP
ncbi:MAG: putative DNA binding domain-containing protein [Synergistaceae bacterium]|jgi:ATP-dependent DNA helicase RecG|nr:putative DNA binding domain-containing protein [Synergistaceae bacterium]